MREFSETSVLPVALRKPQSSKHPEGAKDGVTGKYRVGEAGQYSEKQLCI
jgi:hypothetical protein